MLSPVTPVADDFFPGSHVRQWTNSLAILLPLSVLMLALHYYGHLRVEGLTFAAAEIAVCAALFLLGAASGISRRMRDPSIAAAQLGCAALILFTAMFFSSAAARDLFVPAVLAAFLFLGVFRLRGRIILALGLLLSAAYALVVLVLIYSRMGAIDFNLELLRWMVITVFLVALSWLAEQLADARKVLDRNREVLESALERSRTLSTHDDLTGLCNRRFLEELVHEERSRSDRTGIAASICLIDIDHFKDVNDRAGHAAGDQVLRRFAQLSTHEIRTSDRLGRFGGDEFLLMLPATGVDGAQMRAERLRRAAESAVLCRNLTNVPLTVSIGVAQYSVGETVEEWLNRADHALYEAKRTGRNRVVAADSRWRDSTGAPLVARMT